ELLAQARQRLLQAGDLVAARQDRDDRLTTHPRPRRLRVVGELGEEGIVGDDGGPVLTRGGEPVGLREHRRRGAGEGPGDAPGEDQGQHGDPQTPHERGSSTVKRLPFPSCDSTVTRPPWTSTMPRTIARPRPVPPRSRCAWR